MSEFTAYELVLGDQVLLPELDGMSYEGLFEMYASSSFGEHHASQDARFNKYYGYERAQMLKDLGDDVHPVLHGTYSRIEIFEPLVYFQTLHGDTVEQFSPREICLGRIATQFHDIGECEHPLLTDMGLELVGDIPRTPDSKKSEKNETDEAVIWEYLLDETVPVLRSAGVLPELKAIISQADSSLAAAAFAIGELLGYYQTGITAAYHALLETKRRAEGYKVRDEQSYEQLMKFGKKVPTDWLDEIRQAADRFPYLQYRLDATVPFLEYAHQEHGWTFNVSATV